MKKGAFFIATLTMVIMLPSWLHNGPVSAELLKKRLPDYNVDVSTLPPSKSGVTVVFDLHGVLLGHDKRKGIDELGAGNIAKYIAKHCTLHIQPALLKKTYEIYNVIQKEGNFGGSHDPFGNLMPGIMCDWQCGRKTNAQLLDIVSCAMEQHPEWFSSAVEKRMIEHVVKKMFIPQLMISTIFLVSEGLEYVRHCKERGHTVCVLSNWDSESFELLMKKYPELFILVDGVIVSGVIKHMKPEPGAYDSLVRRQQKHKEIIVFVDDQKENSDAASACGLNGFHYVERAGFLGLASRTNFQAIDQYITYLLAQENTKNFR